uniref:Uncharacterized protein n=1 Tax=Mustela putorius furo TaxID=9669 RepID=M3YBB3_MUSPF
CPTRSNASLLLTLGILPCKIKTPYSIRPSYQFHVCSRNSRSGGQAQPHEAEEPSAKKGAAGSDAGPGLPVCYDSPPQSLTPTNSRLYRTERHSERGKQAGEGETGFLHNREPDAGFDPRTLELRPELKTDA